MGAASTIGDGQRLARRIARPVATVHPVTTACSVAAAHPVATAPRESPGDHRGSGYCRDGNHHAQHDFLQPDGACGFARGPAVSAGGAGVGWGVRSVCRYELLVVAETVDRVGVGRAAVGGGTDALGGMSCRTVSRSGTFSTGRAQYSSRRSASLATASSGGRSSADRRLLSPVDQCSPSW